MSANQVAIKSLKKLLVAVNGFTKSVLQCDGDSGLLALQEQVGRDMPLPSQLSPPYSHQSQEPWNDVTRLSMVRSEPSE